MAGRKSKPKGKNTGEGSSKFRSRWRHVVEIDQAIRSHEAPNCNNLMGILEVSRRTVLRDIDFMRNDLGAPIEFCHQRNGYVYTERHWSMPNIRLTEGDLLAIAIASKAIAGFGNTPWAKQLADAFGKITSSLPDHISVEPDGLATRFDFGMEGVANVDHEILSQLNEAIRQNRQVRMSYTKLDSAKAKKYKIEPYLLLQRSGAWYLVARNCDNGLVPLFNISRVKHLEMLDSEFEYILSDFDKEKYLSQMAWTFHSEEEHKVVLKFTGLAADLVEERIWHPSQKMRRLKDGSLRFEVKVSHLWDIFPWVLRWGASAKVIQPAELKQLVQDEIQKMAKLY